jgi:hypothetical protein
MGSEGKGIILAVLPSTTHSNVVSGPIRSFFLTSEGTDTCPRLVTLVRILVFYKPFHNDASRNYSLRYSLAQGKLAGVPSSEKCPAAFRELSPMAMVTVYRLDSPRDDGGLTKCLRAI